MDKWTPTTKWEATCLRCGPVTIEQKTRPTTCKNKCVTGPRSVRLCGTALTDVRKADARKGT